MTTEERLREALTALDDAADAVEATYADVDDIEAFPADVAHAIKQLGDPRHLVYEALKPTLYHIWYRPPGIDPRWSKLGMRRLSREDAERLLAMKDSPEDFRIMEVGIVPDPGEYVENPTRMDEPPNAGLTREHAMDVPPTAEELAGFRRALDSFRLGNPKSSGDIHYHRCPVCGNVYPCTDKICTDGYNRGCDICAAGG